MLQAPARVLPFEILDQIIKDMPTKTLARWNTVSKTLLASINRIAERRMRKIISGNKIVLSINRPAELEDWTCLLKYRSLTEANDRTGMAVFEPLDDPIYTFATSDHSHDTRLSDADAASDSETETVSLLVRLDVFEMHPRKVDTLNAIWPIDEGLERVSLGQQRAKATRTPMDDKFSAVLSIGDHAKATFALTTSDEDESAASTDASLRTKHHLKFQHVFVSALRMLYTIEEAIRKQAEEPYAVSHIR